MFILVRYPDLCQNTVFVAGKGETYRAIKTQTYRTIKSQPIVRALGPLKTAALLSFHALTGGGGGG